MKLVILNSADTVASNTYFTTLNTNGFEQADKMVDFLESIKPDIIYSSPFIRALQTIYPFCKRFDRRVLPECSLYPIKRYDKLLHPREMADNSIPSYFSYLDAICDCDYKTKLFHSNVRSIEEIQDIKNRVFPFLHFLKTEYLDTNKAILLNTHHDLCIYMLEYFGIKDEIAGDVYVIDIFPTHQSHKRIAMCRS